MEYRQPEREGRERLLQRDMVQKGSVLSFTSQDALSGLVRDLADGVWLLGPRPQQVCNF